MRRVIFHCRNGFDGFGGITKDASVGGNEGDACSDEVADAVGFGIELGRPFSWRRPRAPRASE
jgi:hypothetical protein